MQFFQTFKFYAKYVPNVISRMVNFIYKKIYIYILRKQQINLNFNVIMQNRLPLSTFLEYNDKLRILINICVLMRFEI